MTKFHHFVFTQFVFAGAVMAQQQSIPDAVRDLRKTTNDLQTEAQNLRKDAGTLKQQVGVLERFSIQSERFVGDFIDKDWNKDKNGRTLPSRTIRFLRAFPDMPTVMVGGYFGDPKIPVARIKVVDKDKMGFTFEISTLGKKAPQHIEFDWVAFAQ